MQFSTLWISIIRNSSTISHSYRNLKPIIFSENPILIVVVSFDSSCKQSSISLSQDYYVLRSEKYSDRKDYACQKQPRHRLILRAVFREVKTYRLPEDIVPFHGLEIVTTSFPFRV